MQELEKILDYLKTKRITLSRTQDDGRINSILNEDEVLKLIEKNLI